MLCTIVCLVSNRDVIYDPHIEALAAVVKMASCSSHFECSESDSGDIENLIQPEGTFRVNIYGSFVAKGEGEGVGNGESEPARALATRTVVSRQLTISAFVTNELLGILLVWINNLTFVLKTCNCKSKCSQKKNR